MNSGPSDCSHPCGEPPDQEALARAVLATLVDVGPARLRWLVATGGARASVHPASEARASEARGRESSAVAALDALRGGRFGLVQPLPPGVTGERLAGWAAQARATDEHEMAAALAAAGVGLLTPDHDRWPFDDDPDPPEVLFHRGAPDVLAAGPRVALVGTRRCTAVGRQVAFELGRDLAAAGVTVVSGLASGIDGAAHAGALCHPGPGRPVGVVASGIDVVYPRSSRDLWRRVGREGLLLSETPLGLRPDRWRFPARNRLIAALADVVVVVESHDRGGALLTVDEAAERGRPVMAVPGAVTNPAAAGVNQLLVDGCPPVRSACDVLDLLGLRGSPGSPEAAADADRSPLARAILRDVSAGEIHLDSLLSGNRATVPELLAEIHRLELADLVRLDGSTVVPVAPKLSGTARPRGVHEQGRS